MALPGTVPAPCSPASCGDVAAPCIRKKKTLKDTIVRLEAEVTRLSGCLQHELALNRQIRAYADLLKALYFTSKAVRLASDPDQGPGSSKKASEAAIQGLEDQIAELALAVHREGILRSMNNSEASGPAGSAAVGASGASSGSWNSDWQRSLDRSGSDVSSCQSQGGQVYCGPDGGWRSAPERLAPAGSCSPAAARMAPYINLGPFIRSIASMKEVSSSPEGFAAWFKSRADEAQKLLDLKRSLPKQYGRTHAAVDAVMGQTAHLMGSRMLGLCMRHPWMFEALASNMDTSDQGVGASERACDMAMAKMSPLAEEQLFYLQLLHLWWSQETGQLQQRRQELAKMALAEPNNLVVQQSVACGLEQVQRTYVILKVSATALVLGAICNAVQVVEYFLNCRPFFPTLTGFLDSVARRSQWQPVQEVQLLEQQLLAPSSQAPLAPGAPAVSAAQKLRQLQEQAAPRVPGRPALALAPPVPAQEQALLLPDFGSDLDITLDDIPEILEQLQEPPATFSGCQIQQEPLSSCQYPRSLQTQQSVQCNCPHRHWQPLQQQQQPEQPQLPPPSQQQPQHQQQQQPKQKKGPLTRSAALAQRALLVKV